MIYGSVCSGIEAATVAWRPLGWHCAFVSEIAAFPSAVLAHHYPEIPNYGDLTQHSTWSIDRGAVDVLVGGTPCQSFSVAGLRQGLADPRGNLALVYLGLVDRLRPTWIVWENVPGVLSSNGGRDFGTFLGALGQLGYGWAYRVLDAQYFGVPQRRRRVFVVGHLGDWRRAAAVLFERDSLRGDPPPRRGTRQDTAPTLSARTHGGGGLGTDLDCDGGLRHGEGLIAHALHIPEVVPQAMTAKWSKGSSGPAGDEHHNLLAFDCKASGRNGFGVGDVAPTLRAMGHAQTHQNAGGQIAVATSVCMGSDPLHARDVAMPLTQRNGDPGVVQYGAAVRRLTPRECERLQGFPDDYTLIPWRKKLAPDGPRYKALGNSMAIPPMEWIGRRIEQSAA